LKFKLYLVLVTFYCYFISYSQIVEPSSGIDKQMLQIEMEAQYAVQEEDMQKIIDWSLPSMLFRYGLSNNVELQLNAPLVLEKLYEYDHLVRNSNRFSNIQLGTSLNLWKQKKILPETAFMARVILPINKNENSNKIGEILALNFSNAFLQNFALNYNIGYVHETDGSNAGYYILNLTYNLNQNVHFFIENFSDFKGNSSFSKFKFFSKPYCRWRRFY